MKVKIDQRKLRYVREQLSQFNQRMYGLQTEDLDFQMVPLDKLPNFPSPYASQQNAISRNQLFNPLSIELSDQYESLPIFFQQLVPKTHLNLVQIIQFYDRLVIRKE